MYDDIEPINTYIPANRQSAKRHYGVHPYFTRRPYNVVRAYILNYSKEGDCVVDPFGGSGVTAIEAFLENRHAIHNDLNPLANFIARGIANLAYVTEQEYKKALLTVEGYVANTLQRLARADERHLAELKASVQLPTNICLPDDSDANCYYEMFTLRQLIGMAILRDGIEALDDSLSKDTLRLAWSATLTKQNKTFLSAKGRVASRGGSSIFSIYRYKLAKEPVELPVWETFYERAGNILAAIQEVHRHVEFKRRGHGWCGQFDCYALDVNELSERLQGSADYIFTDPPYGGHISYLDLSLLWNNWLGHSLDTTTKSKELIVGGDLRLSEENYIGRLYDSMRACVRMLKPHRWMTVVFQHWNLAYFNAILSAAVEEGAELRAAIPQVGDVIWSMHKKKNKESVLAGETILTFFKSGETSYRAETDKFDLPKTVRDFVNANSSQVIHIEEVLNHLILQAWRQAALDSLNISKEQLLGLMKSYGWQYDVRQHHWTKHFAASLFDDF